MKDDRFKRALKISTGAHAAVLVLLVLAPLIARWVTPRKPPEMITFIDLMQEPPSLPEPVDPVVTPQPEPEPEPEPEIPEIAPTKPKPEKPKIKVSTNRVVRKSEPTPPKPNQPQLTREQIAKLLAQGVTRTSPGGSMGGDPSALAEYYAHVRDTMYGAWRQPSGIGAVGTSADVVVRVQRNGQVLSRRLARGSGSAAFDATVMTAVQSVSRLRPLPADVQGPHLDITVQFELQGL